MQTCKVKSSLSILSLLVCGFKFKYLYRSVVFMHRENFSGFGLARLKSLNTGLKKADLDLCLGFEKNVVCVLPSDEPVLTTTRLKSVA